MPGVGIAPGGAWRLLCHDPDRAAWNMAVDEAILVLCGRGESPPTLRFYAWDPPAVSIGYAQPLAAVDRDACRRAGVDVVRRITGGRAVLHEDEVTYSVAALEGALPGGVLATYRLLAGALVTGLRLLGVEAEVVASAACAPLAGTGRASGAGRTASPLPCFAAPGRYEIAAGGRKLVGSAQARRGGALLQHGSLPLTFRPERLLALLGMGDAGSEGDADQPRVPEVRAMGLVAAIGRRPSWGEVVAALTQGFQDALGIAFVPGALTPAEEALARRLAEEKYASEAWNARR